jgi:type I restriction enzyme S subunit
MSLRLKPYPAMKDSGVSWLGPVPEHWAVLPIRALFSEVNERDHPDEQMLSVTITKGVIPQKALLEGSSKKDGSNQDKSAYKLVCPADLAYNKMRAWQGAIGVSDLRGIVSPAYVVVRLRDNNCVGYFHHLFRTPQFAKEAERWSYGITSDMWSLRPEHFKMIYCLLPPREEQAAIVRFLDYADRRIRRYVRAKLRLIELSNEATIAILSSLLPAATGKEGAKLAHFVDLLPGFAFPSVSFSTDDRDIRLLRGVNVAPGSIRWLQTVYWPRPEYERFGLYQLRDGDLVIGMDRPWIRSGIRVAQIAAADLPALLLQRVGRLRSKLGLEQGYLRLLLMSRYFREYFEPILTGISVPHISPEQILSFRAPLPSVEEQRTITQRYAELSVSRDAAVLDAGRGVELMREYRTSLIADVVTGKLDVRGLELPESEEAEELPPAGGEIAGDATEERGELEPVEEIADTVG